MNSLTHQARVEEETSQLQFRLRDLRDFMRSQTFHWLEPYERALLTAQEKHMSAYLAVLYVRLNFWQKNHEPARTGIN